MRAAGPTSALRIGLVTPAWPGTRTPNGISTAVTHIATGLEACGHQVTIIALAEDGPPGAVQLVFVPDLSNTLLDRLRWRLDPWGALHGSLGKRIAAAANEAIRRHGIEVLVMEESFGWVGTVQQALPIPVVATLHGPWCLHKRLHGGGATRSDRRREAAEARALHQVSAITSPSLDALRAARESYGPPDVPQDVIRNPMPLDVLVPVDPADPALAGRLLFVGRFDYHKGGDVVIEAFARVAARHPRATLTFVGPDLGVGFPDGRRLDLQAALSRLDPEARARIDIRGACSRDEVAQLRRSHGIAIVSSRYENFGGTMTEAMSAGAALVCTDVGGCPELVADGETGLLVPPDDPGALAAACLRLLDDPQLASRLGRAARAHIAQTLAPDVIGRQMADFLAPICRGAGPRLPRCH